jgi:DNA-binding XRE family transcriptional regulator|tara:strand:- start:42 stop:305 length:264 start_codon:yes stop_codon:yes gene_type:complete
LIFFFSYTTFTKKALKKNIPQKIEKILENLRLQRIKKGYSQEYLGEQLGLSQVAYHKIENGKTKLQVKCLLKLCMVLEIEVEALVSN